MSIPYIGNKVKQLRRKFSQSVGLPIKDTLPESAIEGALAAENYTYRACFFDPILTTWAFLSQTLGFRSELPQSDQPCDGLSMRPIRTSARCSLS